MKKCSVIKPLRALVLISSILMLQGCVSTVVGAVVDTAIEVVKVPFKVGGAIIDAASGDKEEAKKPKESNK